MNEKSWRLFLRGLVQPKNRKLELPKENGNKFVSRSIDYDRNQEERTIRLFRVVRILRFHGFTVERHGELFVIKDAQTPRI